jgi:hypothetical protein
MDWKASPVREESFYAKHRCSLSREGIAVCAPIVIAPPIARGYELSRRIAAVTITVVLKHRAVWFVHRRFSGVDILYL